MNTLTRDERLCSKGIIQRIFDEGRGGHVYPLRYMWIPCDDAPQTSVLFSVPKKFFKKAHDRNLLRRRTKEAYRLNKVDGQSLQLALIYSTKEILSYRDIEQAVQTILFKIHEHVA